MRALINYDRHEALETAVCDKLREWLGADISRITYGKNPKGNYNIHLTSRLRSWQAGSSDDLYKGIIKLFFDRKTDRYRLEELRQKLNNCFEFKEPLDIPTLARIIIDIKVIYKFNVKL